MPNIYIVTNPSHKILIPFSIHILKEQLQINLLHQTQLSSGPGKPNSAAMQQLQQQQQQLVAQMQMTQQAIMLGQSLESSNGGKERNGRERHASEAGTTSSSSEGSLKENRPDNNNFKAAEQQQHNGDKSSMTDRLYVRGHCQWPGCDVSCSDVFFFRRHLAASHSLDDKTTAQTRVQLQIVSQLELQLKKEKDRLDAMMRHLRLESHNGELEASPARRRSPPPMSNRSPSPKRFKSEHSLSPPPSQRSSQQLLPHLANCTKQKHHFRCNRCHLPLIHKFEQEQLLYFDSE